MDIYPLSPKETKKIDNSIGYLNTYGTLCLLDEIKKHKCIFTSKSYPSQEKQQESAWKKIQEAMQVIGVKQATETNIKITWQNLLSKYSKWIENPASYERFHIIFDKMSFLDIGKEYCLKPVEEVNLMKLYEEQQKKIAETKEAAALEELKISESAHFACALIDSVKKATYLRGKGHREEYDVDLAMKHPTLHIVSQNMRQMGFRAVQEKDVIDTWTVLLKNYEAGKEDANSLKSDLSRRVFRRMAFVEQKPVQEIRKIYLRPDSVSNTFEDIDDREDVVSAVPFDRSPIFMILFCCLALFLVRMFEGDVDMPTFTYNNMTNGYSNGSSYL